MSPVDRLQNSEYQLQTGLLNFNKFYYINLNYIEGLPLSNQINSNNCYKLIKMKTEKNIYLNKNQLLHSYSFQCQPW